MSNDFKKMKSCPSGEQREPAAASNRIQILRRSRTPQIPGEEPEETTCQGQD